jgi:hypothetical protein
MRRPRTGWEANGKSDHHLISLINGVFARHSGIDFGYLKPATVNVAHLNISEYQPAFAR